MSRERHIESSRPGELLAQDTFFVGSFKGLGGHGKVYLHSIVDTYGSYAFGFLHTSKVPEAERRLRLAQQRVAALTRELAELQRCRNN